MLSLICKRKGFVLIDNRNIDLDDLQKDCIQFLEKGKVKLARNFFKIFY